jgi:hypothetical protein
VPPPEAAPEAPPDPPGWRPRAATGTGVAMRGRAPAGVARIRSITAFWVVSRVTSLTSFWCCFCSHGSIVVSRPSDIAAQVANTHPTAMTSARTTSSDGSAGISSGT